MLFQVLEQDVSLGNFAYTATLSYFYDRIISGGLMDFFRGTSMSLGMADDAIYFHVVVTFTDTEENNIWSPSNSSGKIFFWILG